MQCTGGTAFTLQLGGKGVDATFQRLQECALVEAFRGARNKHAPVGEIHLSAKSHGCAVRCRRGDVDVVVRQIEPVTQAQYMRWLLRWQHIAPGTQVTGEATPVG